MRLSTDLATTSWNTMPANSGVRTVRTSPGMPGSEGCGSSLSRRCRSHLTRSSRTCVRVTVNIIGAGVAPRDREIKSPAGASVADLVGGPCLGCAKEGGHHGRYGSDDRFVWHRPRPPVHGGRPGGDAG